MFVIDVVAIGVAGIGLVSIVTLMFGVFQPIAALVGGLFLAALVVSALGERLRASGSPGHGRVILLLVLFALLFRTEPYNYVIGGQDEGVYVNMASEYARSASAHYEDRVRESVSRSSELLKLYDENNIRYQRNDRIRQDDRYEGSYLPGVYVEDLESSSYVFQFYPLHPLYMSIAGAVFGQSASVYALVLFGILSVVFAYLLLIELTGNRIVSAATAVLLAVNPLHAFFSKFPVTEVVALCFTLGSFYYLVRYDRSSEPRRPWWMLVLSAVLMGGFFFTRISGFMYIPFFYALFWMIVCFEQDENRRKGLMAWIGGVLGMYVLSVLYGLTYSYPYSYDIYRVSFKRLFGGSWIPGIGMIVLALAVGLVVLVVAVRNERLAGMVRKAMRAGRTALPYLLFAVFLYGLYKMYAFGFTDTYADTRFASRWDIPGHGLQSLRHVSSVVAVHYLSVPIFASFLVFAVRRQSRYGLVLLVFLAWFWVYVVALKSVVPYQYYYARYLVTEAVPYTMIFVAVWFARKWSEGRVWRWIAGGVFIFALVQFGYFTAFQFQGRVAENADRSIDVLSDRMTGEDLVIDVNVHPKIKTALVFIKGLNVFTMHQEDVEEHLVHPAFDRFSNVYVIANRRLDIPGLEEEYHVAYREGVYEHVPRVPRKFAFLEGSLYRYRFDRQDLSHRRMVLSGVVEPASVENVSGLYADGVWTDGNMVMSSLRFPAEGVQAIRVNTKGWHPMLSRPELIDVQVFVNDVRVDRIGVAGKSFTFALPKHADIIDSIRVRSNTFVPKEQGINEDTRNLGIDIGSIEFIREHE